MGVGASTRVNVRARWRAIPSHMDGCLSVSQKTVLSIQGLPGDSDFKTSLLELKAQASPFSKSADFLPLAHTQGQKAPVDVVVGVSCWSTLVMSSCCPASASARVARLPNGPADSPEPDERRQAGLGGGGGGGGGVSDRLRAAKTCMEELKVPAAPPPQSLPSPLGVWTSYLLRRGQSPFCFVWRAHAMGCCKQSALQHEAEERSTGCRVQCSVHIISNFGPARNPA